MVTAMAMIGGIFLLIVTFVVGTSLLPGGISAGRFKARAYLGPYGVTGAPAAEIGWSPLRQRPLVYDPKGPEIQVGPEIPWTEGGRLRIIFLGMVYDLRVEMPSGRYQIAPPLP